MELRPSRIERAVIVVLSVAVLLGQGAIVAADQDDPWKPFRRLVGAWEGESSGFGIVSDVTHRWEFVLQGKFLRLTTRSVPRTDPEPGPPHEDTGYLSRDTDRGVFVFRHFLSEGFVNTYEVTTDGQEPPTLRFEFREAESAGGMRARMHATFPSDGAYEMELELAPEGKEFAPCQQVRMTRVR